MSKNENGFSSPHPTPPMELAEVLDGSPQSLTLDVLHLRLASMIAPRRWRSSIQRLVQELEQGKSLEDAFAAERAHLPAEFSGLFEEALQTPEPSALLLEALTTRQEVRGSWREFLALVTYPVCLFLFAVGVAVVFSYMLNSMVSLQWVEDFGLTGLDYVKNNIRDQNQAIVGLGIVTAWVGVVLLTIRIAGPVWAWLAIVGGLVFVGRPLRWLHLRELLCRLQLFVSREQSTLQAAEAVARSFANSGQAMAARQFAQQIAAGSPLGRSCARSMLADGLCRPALLMLDHRPRELSNELTHTADLLGRLTDQRCRTLATILPVLGVFLVGSIIWASFCAYIQVLMPLVSMITSLA